MRALRGTGSAPDCPDETPWSAPIIAASRARAKEALFFALVKQKRGSFKGKIIFLIACPSAKPRSVLIFAANDHDQWGRDVMQWCWNVWGPRRVFLRTPVQAALRHKCSVQARAARSASEDQVCRSCDVPAKTRGFQEKSGKSRVRVTRH
jgi:hypothetical protein